METEAVRREAEPGRPSKGTEGGTPERLPEGWLCARDCEIGGPPGSPVRVGLVLMHPKLGVALIDTEGQAEMPEDRVGILRERLEQARFGTIFGGHLPILQSSIAPGDLASLPGLLTKAFGELPPLTVGGGPGWVKTMARLVVPADRLWTDNLLGAPPSLKDDEDREGSGLLRRPAALVPMRRTNPSEDRRAEFERWSRPQPRPRSARWLALGGAAFGLAALAGALGWFAMLPASRGTRPPSQARRPPGPHLLPAASRCRRPRPRPGRLRRRGLPPHPRRVRPQPRCWRHR